MMSSKRKTNRQNPGYIGQTSRMGNRGPKSFDKNLLNDGVYGNSRFNHLAVSLVGCVVQLQVKNGGIYDGILRTYSPKMDIVLEMVHKHEDMGNNNQNSSVPSKDRLLEKVIFHQNDILTLTALDVDLDYAVKDTFTDAAISKCNSSNTESDLTMKELQPWEGGEGEELGGLESRDSPNGWDPNDMFRTNAERFNVKSSYDDTLSQYTTPLEKKDTQEFKDREKQASRLANEIEKSDTYKQRIDMENGGDGDDEEDRFSAVRRTHENNSTVPSGGAGKYIPPAKRHLQGDRRGNAPQQKYNSPSHNMPHRSGGHPPPNIPPRLQNQHHHHQHHQHAHSTCNMPPSHHPVHSPPQHITPQPDAMQRVNGNAEKEERERERVEPERRADPEPTTTKTSPNQTDSRVGHSGGQSAPDRVGQSAPDRVGQSASDSRVTPVSPGGRSENVQTSPLSSKKASEKQECFQKLRDFSTNFKLTDESKKEEAVVPTHEESSNKENSESQESKTTEDKTPDLEHAPKTEVLQKDSNTGESSKPNEAKNYILNPLAPSFQPRQAPQQQQSQMPPRPQTQSPVTPSILPTQPMPAAIPTFVPMQPQPFGMINTGHSNSIISVNPPQTNAQPQYKPPKRASVSVNQPRADLTAAAAQAATGQPLFNQATIQPYSYIPMPQMVQQGYQVMPMPAATGQRMMTPTSVPMVPTSHGAQSQSHTPQGYTFMAQAQPMPAHVFQQSHQPQPAHMPMHTGQGQNQQGQMNPQTAGHHPAPSPVQQHPGQQPPQQGRPPNSGTPQPQGSGAPFHNIAPTNLPGHPPIVPSPQNQSTQQTMHPTIQPIQQYTFSSQNPPMYPGQGQGNPMYSQPTHPPISASQGTHGATSHMNPTVLVYQNPPMQQTHPHQHPQQFSHMSGPGQQPMMQPGMPGGVPTNSNSNVIHQHYVQGAPPPVQPYQHSQNH